MNDGAIVFSTALDNSELEKQYQQTIKKIESLNQKIYQKQQERLPLTEQAQKLGVGLDVARGKLYDMQSATKGAFSSEQIKEQQETVNALKSEWNRVQTQVDRYDGTIKQSKTALGISKEHAGELAKNLAGASSNTAKMDAATKKVGKSMGVFATRLRGILLSAFVFNIISTGLRGLTKWLGSAIKANDAASAAIAKLKAALLTMVQPLVSVVIPAFARLVQILTVVVTAVSRVVAALFGMTIEQAKDSAESLNDEIDAVGDLGGAAQKAERQLASFDEINRLTSSTASGGGAGASGATKPDFSGLENISLPKWLENLVSDLEIKIRNLKFSWDSGKILQNQDAWIIALSGILGAVIGGMFGGVKGAVIGLILGMAIGLITCTFLDKTDNPKKYKALFTVVLAAILGAVIGSKFGGLTGAVIGLSLGLLVGITAVAFQEGAFGSWDSGDTWITVLSAILFAVIGFAFGGVVGGIIGLALGATISIIEVSFLKNLSNEEGDKIKWRLMLGSILGAVLGIMFSGLLAVSGPVGAAIGLVLGLFVAFASVQFDPKISSEAKDAAQKIFTVVLGGILGVILGAMYGGLFGAVIGLTIGLAIGWAKVTFEHGPLNDRRSGNGSGSGFDGGGGFGGNSYAAAYSLPMQDIPHLARGAVIPPNREFMAVLGDQRSGTNIEAPLDTMVQAFKIAGRQLGMGGGSGNTTLVMEVDGQQFAKLVYKFNNAESRRMGVQLVEV